MLWADKLKDTVMIAWIVILLLALVAGGAVRKATAWLLMKLYDWFIGSKDHIAPI